MHQIFTHMDSTFFIAPSFMGSVMRISRASPPSNGDSPTFFSGTIQRDFVLRFHTHSLKQHQLPTSGTTLTWKKNVSRTTIIPITRGHRRQVLNSSATTMQTGLPNVTNSQMAAHGSWLVRSFPNALGFSQSNLHVSSDTRQRQVCWKICKMSEAFGCVAGVYFL